MNKKNFLLTFFIALFLGSLIGSAFSFYIITQVDLSFLQSSDAQTPINTLNKAIQTKTIVKEESAIIDVVDKTSPAVVSIIVTKDLPKIETRMHSPFGNYFPWYQVPVYTQKGYEKKTVGGGTGFIVTKNGFVVTNRHVVSDHKADYTVLMNNKKRYPAKVIARYDLNDVAILKINDQNLPVIELGDSDNLKVGQAVVAIGNALGEYQNTVSQGVVSGLSRSITASSGHDPYASHLFDLIQTDAAINLGNSGGPLLNLAGQVIGINTAIAHGSQNIGFAIPINAVKNIIKSVSKHGKIIKTLLGVRYLALTPEIARQINHPLNNGALVIGGRHASQPAVLPGSPADIAGIKDGDVITKINDIEINSKSPLYYVLNKFKPNETVTITINRNGKTKLLKCTLKATE